MNDSPEVKALLEKLKPWEVVNGGLRLPVPGGWIYGSAALSEFVDGIPTVIEVKSLGRVFVPDPRGAQATLDNLVQIHGLLWAIELDLRDMTRPQLPRMSIIRDGDKWLALLGENIQEGVCGFGKTPAEAITEFDKVWGAAAGPRRGLGSLGDLSRVREGRAAPEGLHVPPVRVQGRSGTQGT